MKKIVAIIISLLFFIVMFAVISILGSFKKPTPPVIEKIPIPTPKITEKKKDAFDEKNFDSFMNIVKNRPTPAVSDATKRQEIIASLGNKTGILLQNESIQISYLKGVNDFEVEILTNDIAKAQNEAIIYFKSKGLSEDGICKLPVFFFCIPTGLRLSSVK
jgi:hypothetical protein